MEQQRILILLYENFIILHHCAEFVQLRSGRGRPIVVEASIAQAVELKTPVEAPAQVAVAQLRRGINNKLGTLKRHQIYNLKS